MNWDYGSFQTNGSVTAWDADVIQHCHCHSEGFGNGTFQNMSAWTGYDCSRRACPTGDYPFRDYYLHENGTRITKEFEKQQIGCDGAVSGGNYTLTFRGATTQPIQFDGDAASVKASLEALPSVGTVEVDGELKCSQDLWRNLTMTFTSELGDLPLTSVDSRKLVGGGYVSSELVAGSKEDVVCSHRGVCDETIGECECFSTYESSDANNSFGLRGDCGFMRVG